MKYLLWAFVFTFLIPRLVHADIRITEVAWMGTSASQYSEWIELYNDGDESVDLSGWKFLKAGSTVLFTLSSTIEPGAYVLVERTTASAPDAVPDVDDESGTFGGSGLSNSGENLVLKDVDGNTIDELEYASGWPGGDAKSKETMQWNGSSWITAAPTPKQHVSTSSSGTSRAGEAEEDEHPIPTISANKPHVEFVVPSTIYKGVSYTFEAQPVLEFNYRITKGTFYWNMGDGTTMRQSDLAPIIHTYQYPGTYTISFSFTDPTNQFPKLTGTKKITVGTPAVMTSVIEGSAIEIRNTSSSSIDLSGWNVAISGKKLPIPEMTIVAEKSAITLPFGIWGIASAQTASLVDPSGGSIARTATAAPAHLAYQEYIPEEEPVVDSEDLVARAVSIEASDTNSTPLRNRTKNIIFGAVALFVIVLVVLLERFMARQEYQ